MIEVILEYKNFRQAVLKIGKYMKSDGQSHFIQHKKGCIEFRVICSLTTLVRMKKDGFKLANTDWRLKHYNGRKKDAELYLKYLNMMSMLCIDFYRLNKKPKHENLVNFLCQVNHYSWFIFGKDRIDELTAEAGSVSYFFDGLRAK